MVLHGVIPLGISSSSSKKAVWSSRPYNPEPWVILLSHTVRSWKGHWQTRVRRDSQTLNEAVSWTLVPFPVEPWGFLTCLQWSKSLLNDLPFSPTTNNNILTAVSRVLTYI